jgi:NitT/TauT family transport system substrate-binding protein
MKSICSMALAATLLAAPVYAESQTVTIGFGTTVGSQYSDLVFGKKLGFFEEEGIDLQLMSFQGTPVLLAQVQNQSIDVGSVEPSLMLISASKNVPLPVRAVYNYFRSTPYEFAVLPDSPIRSVADLKGKKIGVHVLSSGNVILTKAALRDAGIDPETQVTFVPIGVGPAAWKQLQDGTVDILNLWTSEDVKMLAAGNPARRFTLPEKFRQIFTGTMIVHEDTIADRPEIIEGLGRALAKSTLACASARVTCAKSFWEFDPTARPAADHEDEWIANTVRVLEENHALITYNENRENTPGSYMAGSLDAYVDALRQAGLLENTDFEADSILTNQFAKAYDDFDRDEVIARAKAAEAQ